MDMMVFPGQGAQKPGMGRDFFDAFGVMKDLFHEASDILSYDLKTLIFEDPEGFLNRTSWAQPALLTVCVGMVRCLEKELGASLSSPHNTPLGTLGLMAGHSLGEYTALVASGAISFERALILVAKRGKAMEKAYPDGGGMMALLGGTCDQAHALIKETLDPNPHEYLCQVANDNAPGQVVVSGHQACFEDMAQKAKDFGFKRAIPLKVSGPFHSALMGPAQETMTPFLEETPFLKPVIPVISNVTTEPHTLKDMAFLLSQQITHTVRWREILLSLPKQGVTRHLEIGPDPVLTGLAKRTKSVPDLLSLCQVKDLDAFIQAFDTNKTQIQE